MSEKSDARDNLLNLVRDTIKQDEALRTELQMGDKFRFVRDSLSALLQGLEAGLLVLKEETEVPVMEVAEDDINIYVYLFNSHGLDMQSWRKMVSPDVLYEYSVNRPIYAEKEHVEKFIDSRPTRTQHGYLVVAVKNDMILPPEEGVNDALGFQLIKVKEGALKITRVVAFVHNKIDYTIGQRGEIVKKDI